MDFIQTAIDFVKANWAEIIAVLTSTYAIWIKVRNLYYKLKFGSIKSMYTQVQTFKDDTSGLIEELRQAKTQMEAVAKLTYELGRQANIAIEAKQKMNEIVRTVTNDVESIIEEVPEEITVQATVENNNKSISDILGSL